jgi:hypothetical protein
MPSVVQLTLSERIIMSFWLRATVSGTLMDDITTEGTTVKEQNPKN